MHTKFRALKEEKWEKNDCADEGKKTIKTCEEEMNQSVEVEQTV